MTTLNVQLPKFEKSDDWLLYSEQLENYFLLNNLEDDKKVAVLLTVISPNVYKALRDSCEPILPKDKTYEQLNGLLKIHFGKTTKKVTTNVFEQRRKFFRAVQGDKENVQQWLDRLKKMSTSCAFDSNSMESLLRDKFVTGLKAESVFKRLSQEKCTIDLNSAFDAAIKAEAIKEGKQESSSVDSAKKAICRSCGEKNHDFKKCWEKGYSCDNCGKNGHLAKACYLHKEKEKVEDWTDINNLSRHPCKAGYNKNKVGKQLTGSCNDLSNINKKTSHSKSYEKNLNTVHLSCPQPPVSPTSNVPVTRVDNHMPQKPQVKYETRANSYNYPNYSANQKKFSKKSPTKDEDQCTIS